MRQNKKLHTNPRFVRKILHIKRISPQIVVATHFKIYKYDLLPVKLNSMSLYVYERVRKPFY